MPELTPQPLLFPGEAATRDTITDFVKKYGTIENAMANMTDFEKESVGLVSEYAGGDTSELFTAGRGEILETLGKGYDPYSSPYYEPLLAGINQQRELTRSRTKRSLNLSGNLDSRERAIVEQRGDIAYDASINEMMMGLSERERQRRLDVLTPAGRYGQYEEERPLRAAEALRAGDVPRQLQESALGQGQSLLSGYSPSYYWPSYAPDAAGGGGGGGDGGGWGGVASGVASGAAAGSYFGPWGTAIGAGIGGLAGYFG